MAVWREGVTARVGAGQKEKDEDINETSTHTMVSILSNI